MKENKKRGTKTSHFGTSSRISHDSSTYYNSRLYAELIPDEVSQTTSPNDFPEDLHNKIINHSSEQMTAIPDRSLHLVVTSPPYNVTKEYDDDLSLNEYLDLLNHVFSECYRVLVNGGRACINIANLGRKPYIPLSDFISQIMLEVGFHMRGVRSYGIKALVQVFPWLGVVGCPLLIQFYVMYMNIS